MVQVKLAPSVLSQVPDLKQRLRPFQIQISETSDYELGFDESFWVRDNEGRKLQIDFDNNKKDYDRSHKGRGEPLAKALGIKDGIEHVVDLTAGLGIDAVFLTQVGFRVTALERHPLVAFLLTEAKARTTRDDLKNLEIKFVGSEDYLAQAQFSKPTSAYYDPMYPEKKKTALPRQEMVLFRNLVGADLDSETLLKKAMQCPFHKIVVKRPLRAETVIDKPAYQLKTKLLRYDVYYPRTNP